MLSGSLATTVGIAGMVFIGWVIYQWNERYEISYRRMSRKAKKQLRK